MTMEPATKKRRLIESGQETEMEKFVRRDQEKEIMNIFIMFVPSVLAQLIYDYTYTHQCHSLLCAKIFYCSINAFGRCNCWRPAMSSKPCCSRSCSFDLITLRRERRERLEWRDTSSESDDE